MKLRPILAHSAAVLASLWFASCASRTAPPATEAGGRPVNPHPPGTYEHFKAEPSYPKTHDHWKDEALLTQTHPGNSHIKVNLAMQRAFLMNGEQVVIDYPISSGVPSRPTPKGAFYILEKIVDKSSNRYGKMYDAAGKVVNSDADAFSDPVPEGGKFVGAPMRYWMRLTHDGVGHHIGPIPRSRRPASHACIRGPSKVVPTVYSKVKPGTRVVVE
ncbi:MAG: L,D-transpeptidase [Verrucomicrobia bacterium]|nr:L,D-transpeptidase [Verrucomicrobiota bacterium]